MKPIPLKEGIYWVGEVDWDLRNFHGYSTNRGSTYNSYLVIDEKITLIDGVRPYLFDKMMQRLSSLIDPASIQYVIANHVEMDHSGSLPLIMDIAKNATIVTSLNGQKGLLAHYKGNDWNMKVVQTDEEVNIGKRTFRFFLTPMVHWPDNMASYLVEDKILFSNDAFGQHIASHERFDDELYLGAVIEEAKKYYANIVLPYSMLVKKTIEKLSHIPIDMIAPGHGIVWRSHIKNIIDEYNKWAANQTKNKCLIIYDTMWKSTEKIAHALQNAFNHGGISTKMINLRYNHLSDVVTDVLDARFICVGSPTLNSNLLPTVSAFLTYLKGLSPKDRIGLAFGSYGWGGQSVSHVEDALKECGFDLLESIKIQYIPDETQLQEIYEKTKQEIAKRG
ncbi:putative nitric oxide detoxifying norVW flavorubredoxin [Candidatus Kuenenia stuttgartiensis]|uniref:Putative nitric oxide detoxifying norVW flavorubredoxin n=1 Tax=Kuenenia stuttgartiensis TaxID=174633 RepID=Q1Q1M6_KUEST|nr:MULTISPECIES: FprA family A-type flavoprotein [Kuenenia]MBE7548606.1 FprA family A-type flavoprotein [Planctomycetia bacterium]MCF6152235.1 FprA family A-type flavoprotein [Candidatus Kuenenia stuttgartiensis]MCL4727512.1 FprA family A-type flavoprotein [Candidatus Kuenenia stuttgartiensis]MCZ7621518.1 FprA family A-type flavoprotein [Candidatus Kuenenia sp.]QII10940.1 putative nitric oxide detoxifying norVW flavorubredoxin [Candidatus Kuenenia stuttgartiensis]